jgi:hypothetical protein
LLAVQSADTTQSPAALQAYLANPKNQRHREEASQRVDDLLFLFAIHRTDTTSSPAAMRDYLANPENQRHRIDARKRITVFYDQAITELKERAAKQNLAINQVFFDGIVAVLESLKEADHPVVRVGFKSQINSVPTSPEQKMTEEIAYALRLERTPELKRIADRSVDKSAILSAGSTFDPAEISRRENVIFSQFESSVRKAIKKEVLSLQRAKPGQKPTMELAYHVYSPGNLFLYTTVEKKNGIRAFQNTPETSLNGLLRGYNIRWTITVRPAKADRAFVWDLQSEPLRDLNYQREFGDPDWAPYAVILYSAFFDMAGKLILNFGLTPETPPDTFTFDAVASHQTDK